LALKSRFAHYLLDFKYQYRHWSLEVTTGDFVKVIPQLSQGT